MMPWTTAMRWESSSRRLLRKSGGKSGLVFLFLTVKLLKTFNFCAKYESTLMDGWSICKKTMDGFQAPLWTRLAKKKTENTVLRKKEKKIELCSFGTKLWNSVMWTIPDFCNSSFMYATFVVYELLCLCCVCNVHFILVHHACMSKLVIVESANDWVASNNLQ